MFRKDQHVVCRYNGDNGDLIVGRITSVRRSGDVLLVNLLTGSRSVKKSEVLDRRNVVVLKKQAERVVKKFKKEGKSAARALAVEIAKAEQDKEEGVVERVAVSVLTTDKNHCHNDCTYFLLWRVNDKASPSCSLFDEGLTARGKKVERCLECKNNKCND